MKKQKLIKLIGLILILIAYFSIFRSTNIVFGLSESDLDSKYGGETSKAFCRDDGCTSLTFINYSVADEREKSYYNGNRVTMEYDTAGNNFATLRNKTPTSSGIKRMSISSISSKNVTVTPTKSTYTYTIEGKNYSVSNVITKANNNVFYNALPFIRDNGTSNAQDYAGKIAKANNGDYSLVIKKTEVAYKVVTDNGSYNYKSFNVIDEEDTSSIKKEFTNKGITTAWISKVVAIRDEDNYIYNIDSQSAAESVGKSGLDQLFYKKITFAIPDKPKFIVLHYYKNIDGQYVENEAQTTTKEVELNTTQTASYSNKKSNYNYVGVKVSTGNDSATAIRNLSASTRSYGYSKTSMSYNIKDPVTVIAFYYDQRIVQINHILTDKNGNQTILNNSKAVVSGNNNLEFLGGADVDKTYQYYGASYTYNQKTYSYVEGKKWIAGTLAAAVQKMRANGETSAWGSNKTKTTLNGVNYYGDGTEFNSASAVVLNFYYEEPTSSTDRKVYIRHLDENGNLIGKNPTEKINGTVRENGYNNLTGRKVSIPSDTSEYFVIGYQDKMTISKYTNSAYTYLGYQIGNGTTKSGAMTNAQNATRQSGETVNLNNATTSYTYVDFYYRTQGGDGSYQQDIDFSGKLAFVNNPLDSGSSGYSSSTSGEDIDYIASGKALKGYISGAYPYYFRRADYEKNIRTGTKTATITISVKGYISGLTHSGCDSTHKAPDYGDPILDEEGNPTGEREIIGYHTTCQSYSRTITKTLTYTYNVPYEHTYYKIKNFKMYRISKVDLFDSTTNKGEVLFDQGETVYTLNTSSAYQSRLNGGFTDNITTVDLPSSSYSLSDEPDRSCGTGGSDDCSSKTTALSNTLQSRLNAVSASSAASHQNLTFTLTGTNDTFKLPNKPELFNTNKIIQTWSIRNLNEATKKIDTTVPNYPYNYTQYQTVGNATTNVSDFESNPILRIPVSQVNGMRVLKARIYYDIDTVLNRSNGLTSENIGVDNNATQMHEYKDSEVNKVNVLTPLNISVDIATQQTVNHSDKTQVNLQKNATFTITPRVSTSSVAGYNNVDTNEFIKYYYIRCDFDITNVVIYGNKTESEGYDTFTQNEILRSGTWVKVPAGGYITGKATQYTETEGETVDIAQNTIEAVGITKNIPFLLEDYIYSTLDSNSRSTTVFSNYVDNNQIWQYTANTLRQSTYYTIRSIVADGFHMARATRATSNLGRIFDFKLTDCSDLNFKDVFRKSSGNNVNEPTGTVYFSGVKRLRIYDTSSDVGYNETESVSNTKTILPLGPYKNTNITQIDAPKLGYRIAFDLKTTGNISDDKIRAGTRKIVIKPSYYYIGKDGTGYDENITLYYKNAEGKYIPFVNSATPYKIYFKPNDGYRNLSNRSITPNNTFLSDKLEELEISSPNGFVLNYKMLDTSGMGDNFIQSWYGEFKLPNSTIAVQNGGNINSPKTGGYIGVRFNIECVDTINGQTITLSYNKNDSSASPNTNTTQWDYDGYLGFVNPGSEAKDLKLRLGSTTMTLDNNMYNKMKGTVILYDTDNRAAQDFD